MDTLWSYLEISELFLGGHSYTFNKRWLSKQKANYKLWTQKNRYSMGYREFSIFSAINITDQERRISLNSLYEIQLLLSNELTSKKEKRLILDGVHCELTNFKNGETITWKTGVEIHPNLKKLVALIKQDDSSIKS
ncbi:MAG: hypothetical protein R3B47_13885 [Bacteroidia bacterium]